MSPEIRLLFYLLYTVQTQLLQITLDEQEIQFTNK